ncbi:MAG: carboxypeptidase M32 [Solirubrobacteraceae bacterium]
MTEGTAQLANRLAEITDLRQAVAVLSWDQQTMMPVRGAPARAEALATLERIAHERFADPALGELLEVEAERLSGEDPDSDAVRVVTVCRRQWEKARMVPPDLAAELARAGSLGQEAWVLARKNSAFQSFIPYLARNFALAREYVDCFDGFECAYDVLLDDYDPGMRTTTVARLFAELKSELVPLIAEVSQYEIDVSSLYGSFPVAAQRELVLRTVGKMGFEDSSWRLDDAVHPFATGFGKGDVRITTRWDESYFASALFGAMHECGHGLYEAGIADSLQRTPLGHAESLAIHESQSRMWENMVGRGRPFQDVLAPWVSELFSGRNGPGALNADTLYRAVNRVEPSLIRVEADEATYGLHIILRFELEQELIEGRLAIADLPDAWNQRMRDYLGVEVPSDADGVLQDVHWSAGLIGYFATYSLGNLIAGQLWERVHADIPELDDQLAAGTLAPLREWLREHVHQHGAKFESPELLQRVVGGPIEVAPFVNYLKTKLSDVYGL